MLVSEELDLLHGDWFPIEREQKLSVLLRPGSDVPEYHFCHIGQKKVSKLAQLEREEKWTSPLERWSSMHVQRKGNDGTIFGDYLPLEYS